MAIEYRLFLNDIEMFNHPPEMLDMEKTLIRDSGINSDEQIFRTKCELNFTFYGDAYRYILDKRCTNICETIDLRIEVKCVDSWRTYFLGTFNNQIAVHHPKICYIKSKVYDNSYSAMIREKQDNKLFLNLTKAIDGSTVINECPFLDIDMFDEFGGAYPKKYRVWEFFTVYKWIVSYFTNNKISVVSDFFSTGAGVNKYAITTGVMLRFGTNGSPTNNSFSSSYFIPEIDYKNLFKEFRVIDRLYTAVEYDGLGNTIIRIEPESYFYKNNTIYTINELPEDLEESFIQDEIYSEIKVGSTQTQTDTKIYFTPKLRLYSYEEEVYNNCTDCSLQNTLNLVNDWIIDSNVIHEQLKDVTDIWDKELFIIQLDGTDKAKVVEEDDNSTIYPIDGIPHYYYNAELNNYNKLLNWVGGIPECIANYFNQEPCIDAVVDILENQTIYHEDSFNGTSHGGARTSILKFGVEDCDNIFMHNNVYNSQFVNIYDSLYVPPYFPIQMNTTGAGSIIEIPFKGDYKFEVQINATNIMQVNGGTNIGIAEEYKWELKLLIFYGGRGELEGGGNVTPTEYVDDVSFYADFEDPYNETLTVTTPTLTLNAGVVIVPVFRIKTIKNGLEVQDGDAVKINEGYLKMLEAKYKFVEDSSIVSTKINKLKLKFKQPICCTDYLNIENNKYGVFKIGSYSGWIKELIHKNNETSDITLITTNPIC